MLHLTNIKIGHRLAFGFGLMLSLMIGLTVIAMFFSRQPRIDLTETIGHTNSKFALAASMRQSLLRQSVYGRRIGIAVEFSEAREEMSKLIREQGKYGESEIKLIAEGLNVKETAIIAEIKGYEKAAQPMMQRAEQYVDTFNGGQASRLLAIEAAPLQEKWLEALDHLVSLQNDQIGQDLEQFNDSSKSADQLMMGVGVISIMLAMLIAYLLTLSITTPLNTAVRLAKSVANGDLNVHINHSSKDEPGQLLVALSEMVENLKQARQALEKLATQDGLTLIANRRHFDDVLTAEWVRARRAESLINTKPSAPPKGLSLLMIDVDFFKKYNDTFGHQAGDECLKRIAAAITSGCHRPNDLVARYGGEEFAVILPGVTLEGAMVVAERIRTTVGQLKLASPVTGIECVTVSIGVATATAVLTPSPTELISSADGALYQAKHAGRNRAIRVEIEAMPSSPGNLS